MPQPTLYRKGNLVPQKGDNPDKLAKLTPIEYIIGWLKSRMPGSHGGEPLIKPRSPGDKVIPLRAETGSGKSTALVSELYHGLIVRKHKSMERNIAVTQPRRLTAMEIPKDMIQYGTKEFYKQAGTPGRTPLKLGKNIGFQTGIFSKRPIKGMIYMTTGVLTQQLLVMSDDDIIKRYAIIVLDEVHERSIGSDLTMYLMKQFLARNWKRPDCPFLILTSATFDTKQFGKYFGASHNIIEVKGVSFPIEEFFLEYDTGNYIQSAVETVKQIHLKYLDDVRKPSKRAAPKIWKPNDFRDILIFLPGMRDIKMALEELEKLNQKEFKDYPIMPLRLYGALVEQKGQEYESVFAPIEKLRLPDGRKPTRRVILATVVAETGVTIETLGYVIDSGYYNSAEFSAAVTTHALIQKPVTQSMARQRRGRGGRKAPGKWFPLYTEATHSNMLENQYPDILREDVSDFLLNMLIQSQDLPEGGAADLELTLLPKIMDIKSLDLMTLPMADSMLCATEKLYTLGAINGNSQPTPTGILMSRIRKITLENRKMILSGYAFDTSIIDLINIAAMLETGDVIGFPDNNYRKALTKDMFNLGVSDFDIRIADDFIRQLGIFEDFADNPTKEFCDKNGLRYASMMKVLELREEIIDSLVAIGLNPYHNQHKVRDFSKIKQCIYEGYKLNMGVWVPEIKRYIDYKTHQPLTFISSVITPFYKLDQMNDTNPRYVLYDKKDMLLDRTKEVYKLHTKRISVMDGFVSVDLNLFWTL